MKPLLIIKKLSLGSANENVAMSTLKDINMLDCGVVLEYSSVDFGLVKSKNDSCSESSIDGFAVLQADVRSKELVIEIK